MEKDFYIKSVVAPPFTYHIEFRKFWAHLQQYDTMGFLFDVENRKISHCAPEKSIYMYFVNM